jgi:hypothetical protein
VDAQQNSAPMNKKELLKGQKFFLCPAIGLKEFPKIKNIISEAGGIITASATQDSIVVTNDFESVNSCLSNQTRLSFASTSRKDSQSTVKPC